MSAEHADIARGIALSVDLTWRSRRGLVGYRAKRHTGLVDVDAPGCLSRWSDFWEPISQPTTAGG